VGLSVEHVWISKDDLEARKILGDVKYYSKLLLTFSRDVIFLTSKEEYCLLPFCCGMGSRMVSTNRSEALNAQKAHCPPFFMANRITMVEMNGDDASMVVFFRWTKLFSALLQSGTNTFD
jgi:hypothetical protein